jgi:hypothetical protein
MGNLLSAISGQFAKAIILGTLFPVIIIAALNILLVAPLLPETAWLPGQMAKIAVGDEKWSAVVLTFIVLLIAGLLYNLNIPIIRLFEGYPWANSTIGRMRVQSHARRLSEMKSLRDSARSLSQQLTDTATQVQLRSELEKQQTDLSRLLNSQLPDSEDLLLPTRLGNVIRCFERYPYLAYGMEAIVTWPRLVSKIDSAFASTIDEAKTSFDFMLNTSFLCGLTAFGILLIGLGKPSPLKWEYLLPWLWRDAVFVAMTTVFYWLAVNRASAWGEQVRSAFDIYRFDLLKAMGYVRRPLTSQEEKILWYAISSQLLYVTSSNLPVPYEEPSARIMPFPIDIQFTLRRVYRKQEPNLRIPVSLVLRNPNPSRDVSSLTIVETIPDGFKYVPNTAVASIGLLKVPLNVMRLAPFELFIGAIPANSTVKIDYTIKPI